MKVKHKDFYAGCFMLSLLSQPRKGFALFYRTRTDYLRLVWWNYYWN